MSRSANRHDLRRAGRGAGLVLALAVTAGAPARAADHWTTPFTGVRALSRTTGRPWVIHAVKVDLCAAGVSVRATTSGEKWRTVSSFANRVGAEVATNGDFFSYDTHLPTGLAIGDGTAWHADMRSSGETLFGDDRVYLNKPATNGAAPGWARNAVGGRPLLVDGGAVLDVFNRGDCVDRHPRTAIGLSADRRTLILAVVDGRSNASVGMNCAELADLMHGLGAYRAMNMDGGGSTDMYIRGSGVVNTPSDGHERTVSNHLGVLASGSGAPGSCAFDVAEVLQNAHLLDAPAQTDLNGDGRADLCARASNGLHCALSSGDAFGADVVLPALSNDAGFDAASHYATLRMADVTGDGRADVCARDAAGFGCFASQIGADGTLTFGERLPGPELTDAHGWDDQKYFTTLRLADLDDDGRADLCARAAAGVVCYKSTGAGFGEGFAGPELSDEAGFGAIDRYGTIRMADVDADGRADLCARTADGLRCWRSTGAGFLPPIEGPAWSDAAGFQDVSYWSTLRMADLDGDGRADACARGPDGYACALSLGDAFGPVFAGPQFRDDNGWGDHDNYGNILLGDVDADGDRDICARANARAYCWLYDAQAFATRIDGPEWADAHGWGNHVYNTSMRLADVNGDRRADLCARSSSGVDCYLSDGAGFPGHVIGPRYSDEHGWSAQQYFTTLRLGDRPCTPERCNGRDDDCDGQIDEGCLAPDAGVAPSPDAGVAPSRDAGPPDSLDSAAGEAGPKPPLTDGAGDGREAGAPDGSRDADGPEVSNGSDAAGPGDASGGAFGGLDAALGGRADLGKSAVVGAKYSAGCALGPSDAASRSAAAWALAAAALHLVRLRRRRRAP